MFFKNALDLEDELKSCTDMPRSGNADWEVGIPKDCCVGEGSGESLTDLTRFLVLFLSRSHGWKSRKWKSFSSS